MNKFLAWIVTAFLTFAVLLSLLATASAFAAEPAMNDGVTDRQDQPLQSADRSSEGAGNASAHTQATPSPATMSASQRQAASKRVYLEDFQLIHKPVTRKRSTEMIWLGKSKRPN